LLIVTLAIQPNHKLKPFLAGSVRKHWN